MPIRNLLPMRSKSFRCRLAPGRPIGALWAILSSLVSIVCVFCFMQPVWFTGKWPGHEHYLLSHLEPVSLTLGLFTFCQRLHGGSTVYNCQSYDSLSSMNLHPSFTWQLSIVSFGIGTLVLLLTSVVALMTLCCDDSKNLRISRISSHVQLLSVLLMFIGLVMLPSALGSPLVQSFCGPNTLPYHLGHCQFGWSYALSFMGTMLALFCPFLARHTSFQSFEIDPMDINLLSTSPYHRLVPVKEYYI